MQHYVGLDVLLRQTAVCVVDQTGKIKREGMVASDPDVITDFIAANAPHAARIGLESGATSTWLWTEKRDLPIICIDARHAKAALKMQINKSDRNDAVGIARIMQCGWYKEVRVKDLSSHAIRALLVSRALLVKIKRDFENQIRGLLKNLGLVIGRCKLNTFTVRANELIDGEACARRRCRAAAQGARSYRASDCRSGSQGLAPGAQRAAGAPLHVCARSGPDHGALLPGNDR